MPCNVRCKSRKSGDESEEMEGGVGREKGAGRGELEKEGRSGKRWRMSGEGGSSERGME